MPWLNNQTNRVYLEKEIYKQTRQLKNIETTYMMELAAYNTRCEMLRAQIDSMQEQIDIDDKNSKNNSQSFTAENEDSYDTYYTEDPGS